MDRRRFLAGVAALAFGGALAAVGAGRLSSPGLEAHEIALPVADLPGAFEGYRIALLSDLHVEPFTPARLLERAVAAAVDAAPDLIALPGDFVTSTAEPLRRYLPLLAELRAPDGVVASLGNHDHGSGAVRIRSLLDGAGIEVLVNEGRIVTRGDARLAIAGLDDALLGRPSLAEALRGVAEDVPAVLLVHEPDVAPGALADPRVRVQLSGHSHGGQIRIPFVAGAAGAPVLPSGAERFPIGRYDLPGGVLYTTRGIGMTGLPIRFACPPEMVVVRLERA